MTHYDYHRFCECFLVYFIAFISLSVSERISSKTYVIVSGNAACIRRLNGTHQVGCSSEISGNVGVLHYVNDTASLDWLINSGPHQPYIALLTSLNFTSDTVQKLRNSKKIAGIIVSARAPHPDNFSPADKCPGNSYGLYNNDKDFGNCKKVTWNEFGNGMFFEDFEFPISLVSNKNETDYLINNCYLKFNEPIQGVPREYPLCAVQMKSRMSAAKDSETCMRRTRTATNLNPDKYCDPLGDKNVIGFLKDVPDQYKPSSKSIIMAVARMDSYSLFENIYPSADNHVSGIVALLAAAEAIGKVKHHFTNDSKDILFTFLNGEAFDYIGSSRMIYDMDNNALPLNLKMNHIDKILEVNQLAFRDEGKIWIHSDPISRREPNISTEIDKMIQSILDIGKNLSDPVGDANQTWPLPPSSTQKFLQKQKIPAVVLTDHKGAFTNRYYNSRLDLARTIHAEVPGTNQSDGGYNHVTDQAKNLTEAATLVARSLYTLATNSPAPQNLTADVLSVQHMLYCFLISPNCELFKEIIPPSNEAFNNLVSRTSPYPFYVSVYSSSGSNNVTRLIQRLLTNYIGDKEVNQTSGCTSIEKVSTQLYNYLWMAGPLNPDNRTRSVTCVKNRVTQTKAYSPAFEDTDYHGWNTFQYSTWTESSWKTNAILLRIFLIPSKAMETSILSGGVILTLVSMVLIYFLNKKSDILFAHPGPSTI
ncbi:nicastrin-like isoform X2 [Saccostrea echinata]|uniref:nicastrin-like isoform X2 n=1 Tax=Saccostrea echinata TaxID=191078 RepID=UPI002A7FBF13|nr:nicastrin-like isoform X2 [Saccostrea echinata]